jgi:hypothetical protein
MTFFPEDHFILQEEGAETFGPSELSPETHGVDGFLQKSLGDLACFCLFNVYRCL